MFQIIVLNQCEMYFNISEQINVRFILMLVQQLRISEIIIMKFTKFHWSPVESSGLRRTLVDSKYISLDSSGVHWSPAESSGVQWSPVESTGIQGGG